MFNGTVKSIHLIQNVLNIHQKVIPSWLYLTKTSLCAKHHYVDLPSFNDDEVNVLIPFYTLINLFTLFIVYVLSFTFSLCVYLYAIHSIQIDIAITTTVTT